MIDLDVTELRGTSTEKVQTLVERAPALVLNMLKVLPLGVGDAVRELLTVVETGTPEQLDEVIDALAHTVAALKSDGDVIGAAVLIDDDDKVTA